MLSADSEDAHFQLSIRFITPPKHCAVVFRPLSTQTTAFSRHEKLLFDAHTIAQQKLNELNYFLIKTK